MELCNIIDMENDFYGNRLLNNALNDLYFFEEEEIENQIMECILKSNENPKLAKYYIWSNVDLKNKICNVAKGIYG